MRTDHTGRPDRLTTDGPRGDELAADEPADEEFAALDAELARLDRARPSEHQLAGGAPRELAWLLVIGGALGLWASIALILSRIEIASNPDANLACDLNPLIGCGDFIVTWQARLFGVPNAVIGTVAFAAVMTIGVLFLARATVATWFWRALVAGATGAIVWVFWFQFHALTTFRMLCPYCVVVWVVTIPIFVHVVARAAQAGHLPFGERLRRTLALDRWLIVGGWYVLLLVVVGIVFWDQWLLMLT